MAETPETMSPVPTLSQGQEIEYKAFARFVQGNVGVLYLIATCFYRMTGVTIFFVEESGKYKLMQLPPVGHFPRLVTYYVADWPPKGSPGKTALPNEVSIVDAYGEHQVPVNPW